MKKTIYSTLTLLLLSACSSEQVQEKHKETAVDQKIDAVKEAKNVVHVQEPKKESVIDQKIDAIKEARAVVNVVNTKTKEISVASTVQKAPLNASSLYQKSCASCHGENADKPALNASAIISKWSSKQIQDSLDGYKNGTYGGKMKAIMQGQIKPLSSEDIKALSNYISNL